MGAYQSPMVFGPGGRPLDPNLVAQFFNQNQDQLAAQPDAQNQPGAPGSIAAAMQPPSTDSTGQPVLQPTAAPPAADAQQQPQPTAAPPIASPQLVPPAQSMGGQDAQPGTAAPGAPQSPAAQQPYGPQISARDRFFAENPDAAKAFMPARPVGALDGASGFRKALALAFAGLSEYAGEKMGKPGQGQKIINRWNDQNLAQRQYDANAGKYQAEAKNQAYATQLQNKSSEASTGKTVAETNLIGQNLPMQEAAEKEYNDLVGHWQSKDVPNFDAYANAKLQAMPAPIARRIQPLLQNIKQLPQTGKGYSLTMQDDLPKSINVYGKEYDPTDPELQKLPVGPEATADFQRAMQAHQTKLGEQETKDKRVAGFAADRQAAGFGNQAQQQQRQHDYQTQEEGKRAASKHLNDYHSAEQQNNLVQDLASSKSPTDQTSLAFKALGLDLPDGVHRNNDTELKAIQNQGGLSDKAYRAVLNWTSGQTFAPEILKDIQNTATKISKSKMATANAGLQDTYKTYGYKDPRADDTGAIGGKPNFSQPSATANPGGFQVKDPKGGVHSFPNQAAADAFKKAAGIK